MVGIPLKLAPVDVKCQCVKAHRPEPGQHLNSHHIWPLSWSGPNVESNRVWLCPTAHELTHSVLNLYVDANGKPGAAVLKHYPKYAVALALEAVKRAGGIKHVFTLAHPEAPHEH